MTYINTITPEAKSNKTFKVKSSKRLTDIENYRLKGLQAFTYNIGTDMQVDGTDITADVDSGDNHAHYTYPGAWNESYRVDVAGMRWNNTGLSEFYMRMPTNSTDAGVAFILQSGGVAIYTWNNTGADGWVTTGNSSAGAGLSQGNIYPVYGQAVRNLETGQIEFECGVLNGGTWYTTTYTSGFTTACTTLGTFGFGFFQPASADGLFRLPAIVTKLSNSGELIDTLLYSQNFENLTTAQLTDVGAGGFNDTAGANHTVEDGIGRGGTRGLRVTYSGGGSGWFQRYLTEIDEGTVRAEQWFQLLTGWTGTTRLFGLNGHPTTEQGAQSGVAGCCADPGCANNGNRSFWTALTEISAIGGDEDNIRFYDQFVTQLGNDPPNCFSVQLVSAVGTGNGNEGTYTPSDWAPSLDTWYRVVMEVDINTPGQPNGAHRYFIYNDAGSLMQEASGVSLLWRTAASTILGVWRHDAQGPATGDMILDQILVTHITGTVVAAEDFAWIQQPTSVVEDIVFSPDIVVEVRDGLDNPVTMEGLVVTVSRGAGTGTLSGTLTQLTNSQGRATFDNLELDVAENGVTLLMNAPSMNQGTSAAFNVTAAGLGAPDLVSVENNWDTEYSDLPQGDHTVQSMLGLGGGQALRVIDPSSGPLITVVFTNTGRIFMQCAMWMNDNPGTNVKILRLMNGAGTVAGGFFSGPELAVAVDAESGGQSESTGAWFIPQTTPEATWRTNGDVVVCNRLSNSAWRTLLMEFDRDSNPVRFRMWVGGVACVISSANLQGGSNSTVSGGFFANNIPTWIVADGRTITNLGQILIPLSTITSGNSGTESRWDNMYVHDAATRFLGIVDQIPTITDAFTNGGSEDAESYTWNGNPVLRYSLGSDVNINNGIIEPVAGTGDNHVQFYHPDIPQRSYRVSWAGVRHNSNGLSEIILRQPLDVGTAGDSYTCCIFEDGEMIFATWEETPGAGFVRDTGVGSTSGANMQDDTEYAFTCDVQIDEDADQIRYEATVTVGGTDYSLIRTASFSNGSPYLGSAGMGWFAPSGVVGRFVSPCTIVPIADLTAPNILNAWSFEGDDWDGFSNSSNQTPSRSSGPGTTEFGFSTRRASRGVTSVHSDFTDCDPPCNSGNSWVYNWGAWQEPFTNLGRVWLRYDFWIDQPITSVWKWNRFNDGSSAGGLFMGNNLQWGFDVGESRDTDIGITGEMIRDGNWHTIWVDFDRVGMSAAFAFDGVSVEGTSPPSPMSWSGGRLFANEGEPGDLLRWVSFLGTLNGDDPFQPDGDVYIDNVSISSVAMPFLGPDAGVISEPWSGGPTDLDVYPTSNSPDWELMRNGVGEDSIVDNNRITFSAGGTTQNKHCRAVHNGIPTLSYRLDVTDMRCGGGGSAGLTELYGKLSNIDDGMAFVIGTIAIAIFSWEDTNFTSLGTTASGTFTAGNVYDVTVDVQLDHDNSRTRFIMSTVDDLSDPISFTHFQNWNTTFNRRVDPYGVACFAPVGGRTDHGFGPIIATPLPDLS